jgi:chromosomal replication initiation ATPase DnaA
LQLSFDFPFQDKYLPEDFIVSACNQAAFEFVQNYNSNDENLPKIFAVRAPKLAGKTYLANIWQRKLDAEFLNLKELENTNLIRLIRAKRFYIIEDIDQIKNQELLLQIFNLAQEKSSFLLLTSSTNLSRVGLKIQDLNSRLKNVFTLEIREPDDHLIKMLLIKNFSAKQLKVSDKVIDFLAKNLQRSFAAIFDMVKLLEFYSLEKKRNITVMLAKEVLRKSNQAN